ncbi:MAG TPA: DUF952 domain-containing protein [Anaerolineales bacterium]|nr:DUF952 domain-containing protein [Anaerolineales bacterium]
MLIYHLTSRSRWEDALQQGSYTAESLAVEGFIHCSTDAQLLPVANAFYRDLADPVVLRIEADRLEAPLRWEAPESGDTFDAERFPHVYGPINLDAVIAATGPARSPDGSYTGFGR